MGKKKYLVTVHKDEEGKFVMCVGEDKVVFPKGTPRKLNRSE